MAFDTLPGENFYLEIKNNTNEGQEIEKIFIFWTNMAIKPIWKKVLTQYLIYIIDINNIQLFTNIKKLIIYQ